MENAHKTTIKIEPTGVVYEFTIRYREEENGMFSWFIPGFNIFYSTKTVEQGEPRGVAMTKSFFKYWIGKEGFQNFIIQLHGLGFKAKDEPRHTSGNVVIQQLLKKERNSATFKALHERMPGAFADSEKVEKKEILDIHLVA